MTEVRERLARIREQIDKNRRAFETAIDDKNMPQASSYLKAIGRMSLTLMHADVPREMIGFAHVTHLECAIIFATVATINAINSDEPEITNTILRGH